MAVRGHTLSFTLDLAQQTLRTKRKGGETISVDAIDGLRLLMGELPEAPHNPVWLPVSEDTHIAAGGYREVLIRRQLPGGQARIPVSFRSRHDLIMHHYGTLLENLQIQQLPDDEDDPIVTLPVLLPPRVWQVAMDARGNTAPASLRMWAGTLGDLQHWPGGNVSEGSAEICWGDGPNAAPTLSSPVDFDALDRHFLLTGAFNTDWQRRTTFRWDQPGQWVINDGHIDLSTFDPRGELVDWAAVE